MTPTAELEIVTTKDVPEDLRVAVTQQNPAFEELLADRRKLFAKVAKFSPVTDPEDTPRMADAKRLQLDLAKNRNRVEDSLKASGETFHLRWKAVCDVRKSLREESEEAEAYLKESSEFGIRFEASRKAELQRERANELAKWTDEVVLTLGELTTAMWEITLAGAKAAKEAAEAAAKAAAEKAAEEAAEREKLRAENQRLLDQQAAERAEAEALIKAEQAKAKAAADAAAALRAKEQEVAKEAMRAAQAEIDKANAEKAELERKEKARIAAEQKKAADEAAAAAALAEEERIAAERAAQAPDKQKLGAFVLRFQVLLNEAPELKSGRMCVLLDTFGNNVDAAIVEIMGALKRL